MTTKERYTSDPLVIYVAPSCEHNRLRELVAQGHSIIPLQLEPDADLILSPTAHWWNSTMWENVKYFDTVLKTIRKERKK